MTSDPKTWFLAARPWSFSMSAISVTIGAVWAAGNGFSWAWYAATLVAMVSLHGATNLLNDYFDVKNRVDTPDVPTVAYRPHPLMNADIGLRQVLVFAGILYAVGVGLGLFLVAARGWPVLWFGLAGFAVSVLYTAGPVALKYRALGEVAVFFMWGPLAMEGAYYVQAQTLSWPLLAVSVPFGVLVSLVLLANNIRDADHDRRRGIRTLPVVLGQAGGRALFVGLVTVAFLAVVVMAVAGPLSLWSLMVLAAVPLAVSLCRLVLTNPPDDADARTAKLDTAFGVLLLISVAVARLV